MAHDKRFALLDKDGNYRFAAIIKGFYQIGKDRRRLFLDLESFAKAILIEGEGGRFVRENETSASILKFVGRRDLAAVAYRLDANIATSLNIPAFGTRQR